MCGTAARRAGRRPNNTCLKALSISVQPETVRTSAHSLKDSGTVEKMELNKGMYITANCMLVEKATAASKYLLLVNPSSKIV